MSDGEIRAHDPALVEEIDPEIEITIATRMITDRVHHIMEKAHAALDDVEGEILDRIIRSIRVRRKAESSYRITLEQGE